MITIPAGLSEKLTGSELESVLLHELAHARRWDNLASVFVHCLVCVFWFHHLLWFVERRLNAERERSCDEMVIDCGIRPSTYLAAIVKVCRFHLPVDIPGVSSMGGGSDLAARFDHILAYRGSRRTALRARLVTVPFAIVMTVLPIAGGYCDQCVSNGQGITRPAEINVVDELFKEGIL